MSEYATPYIVENLKSIKRKKDGIEIIGAYKRTWVNQNRIPLWYEFRSESYNGYHKPEELEIVVNY